MFRSLFGVVVFLGAVLHLLGVTALPIDDPRFDGLDHQARSILARAVPAAPRFVIYSDKFVSGQTGPPDVSQVKGYNVFALSFLLTEGAFDKAAEWTQLTAAQRASVKSQYAAAGISLVVSVFGATDAPTSSGADPVATANTMAAWVIQYGLDGIDVDYEDFNAMNAENGSAEAWLTSFTKQLRVKLPQGQYILTHAPVAPWFSTKYASGAYLTVDKNVGSMIDWYNVQFYNQGTSEYTTCAGLLTASSATWPNSALFQIAASGVSLNKLVIGKPATTGDANNGFIDPSTLAQCVQQAKAKGWSAGVMVWEYPDAAASWIATVRSLSWPVSGGPAPTSTTTSSTPGPTSGSCSGVSAWVSNIAYTGGQQVTFNGHLWTAKWWTQGDTPGGAAGVWTDNGACTSQGPVKATSAQASSAKASKPTQASQAASSPASKVASTASAKTEQPKASAQPKAKAASSASRATAVPSGAAATAR